MKKLAPVVQSHGKHLVSAIEERIDGDKPAVLEGKPSNFYSTFTIADRE